jgi:molecular chaperone DnaK
MPKIVGIDLGTTNSVVAVVEGQEPTVITLAEGARLCPSVVGVTRGGERLVGSMAKRQAVAAPDRTLSSVKREMGVSEFVTIAGEQMRPQAVSACILQKLKRDAEAYLGEPVERAVITVPAYFTDSQRQATKDAGTIAGLEVVRIINEPTAAALAYGITAAKEQTVLVWDLGGGTFDVSILHITEGIFEVLATSGDMLLGGDDWDARIVTWMADRFKAEHNIDLTKDRMALQRLKEAAEKAKIELSTLASTNINLPFLTSGEEGPLHMDLDLARSRMEMLCADLLDRLVPPTLTALRDAKLTPADIDTVILVGGSTRMPAVQELVKRVLGKEPVKGVDPDEAVARGAALQAGVLNAEVDGVLLLDVTPFTLGIETVGGVVAPIIEKNTTIPAQNKQIFTTSLDGQTVVNIRVYQGESKAAAGNTLIGNFQLIGVPRAPKGVPKIEVSFDVDANGIVRVEAIETQTGVQQKIRIGSHRALNPDEIANLKREFAVDGSKP